MALTAEITRQWPSMAENGLLHVGVKVDLKEDDVVVRTGTFTIATSKDADVTNVGSQLLEKVQAWVDRYKVEKQVYGHTKYETLRTGIENNLNLE